jgi:hypothetical protein
VHKRFLLQEYRRSQRGETLVDCREHCHGCGVLSAYDDGWSEEWRCPKPAQYASHNLDQQDSMKEQGTGSRE